MVLLDGLGYYSLVVLCVSSSLLPGMRLDSSRSLRIGPILQFYFDQMVFDHN